MSPDFFLIAIGIILALAPLVAYLFVVRTSKKSRTQTQIFTTILILLILSPVFFLIADFFLFFVGVMIWGF